MSLPDAWGRDRLNYNDRIRLRSWRREKSASRLTKTASLQAIALQDIQRWPLAHAAHESLVASALAIRAAAVARPAFTVSRPAAGPV